MGFRSIPGWIVGGAVTALVSGWAISLRADDIPDRPKNRVPMDWVHTRTLSSAHEIFMRFASEETEEGEAVMTVSDFLHAITPFMTLEQVDLSSQRGPLQELLRTVDLNHDGYISESEFIFFTTLLSIPPKFSHIAFKIFDTNHSGAIDAGEFQNMMHIISQANPIARKDTMNGEDDQEIYIDPPEIFFGDDGQKELSYETFVQFIDDLRNAVSAVQFSMISRGSDTISAEDFALSLLSFGEMKRRPEELTRVAQLQYTSIQISCQEYKDFMKVLESLDDIEFVLRSFVSAGQPFSEDQLRRAARAVAHVQLSDDLLAIIFFLFDVDGDGKLDYNEFVGTLKGRQHFGFSKPKDNPLTRTGQCLKYCWYEEISDRSAKGI